MRSYSLLFRHKGSAEPKRIDFDARDPSAVFELAEREGGEHEMQLFEGDTLLGTIQELGGFWRLSPPSPPLSEQAINQPPNPAGDPRTKPRLAGPFHPQKLPPNPPKSPA